MNKNLHLYEMNNIYSLLRRDVGAAAWASSDGAQPAAGSQPRPPQWKLHRLGTALPTKYLDSQPENIFLKEIPTLITE